MTNINSDKSAVFKIWIVLKRLDLNDDSISAFREITIPRGAEAGTVRQIVSHSFGLNSDRVATKIRNSRRSLVPFNSSIPVNSKNMPYVLEVVKLFQHVVPKQRIIATTVINKSTKTRLQSVVKRIERLEELVPQIKLRHLEKMDQEIDLLNKKLLFLNKRMKMADSHCWRGMFRRPPLW